MEEDSSHLRPPRTLFRCTVSPDCTATSFDGEAMCRHELSHLPRNDVTKKRRYCSICERIYSNFHQHLATAKHKRRKRFNESSGLFVDIVRVAFSLFCCFGYIIILRFNPANAMPPSSVRASPILSTAPLAVEESVPPHSSDVCDDFLIESGQFFSEEELDPPQSSDPMTYPALRDTPLLSHDEDPPDRSLSTRRSAFCTGIVTFVYYFNSARVLLMSHLNKTIVNKEELRMLTSACHSEWGSLSQTPWRCCILFASIIFQTMQPMNCLKYPRVEKELQLPGVYTSLRGLKSSWFLPWCKTRG